MTYYKSLNNFVFAGFIFCSAIISYLFLKIISIETSRDELWYTYYGLCKIKINCENFYLTQFNYHEYLFTPIVTIAYGLVGQISDDIDLYRCLNFIILALGFFLTLRTQEKKKLSEIILTFVAFLFGTLALCIHVPGFSKIMLHARPDAISYIFQSIGVVSIITCGNSYAQSNKDQYHRSLVFLLISASIYWTAALTASPFILFCVWKLLRAQRLFSVENWFIVILYFVVLFQFMYYLINFSSFLQSFNTPNLRASGNMSFDFTSFTTYPLKDTLFIGLVIVFSIALVYWHQKEKQQSHIRFLQTLSLFLFSVTLLVLRDFGLRHLYSLTFIWFLVSALIAQRYLTVKMSSVIIFASILAIFVGIKVSEKHTVKDKVITVEDHIFVSYKHRNLFEKFIPFEAFIFLNFDKDNSYACEKLGSRTYQFFLSEKNYYRMQTYVKELDCMLNITNLHTKKIGNEDFYVGNIKTRHAEDV